MNNSIYYLNDCIKYDVIGDIHSHYNELVILLIKLGYRVDKDKQRIIGIPENRKLIFVGDLTDRGKYPIQVLNLVIAAVQDGYSVCARGNHDDKLRRALLGRDVKINEELKDTLNEIYKQNDNFNKRLITFLNSQPYQIIINKGGAVIAHGGMKDTLQGVQSNAAMAFALYGDPTGDVDENGHPIRRDWAVKYKGNAAVIYGHTPVEEVKWINNTINIDTGCYKTGILTAVRMPEREILSVNLLDY